MSDKRAIIALVVVVAFAGIFGASQAGMFALTDANLTTTATTMRYLGHVTAVVYDSNGNIKSYFQTDNKVVNSGRNCASDLVFGTGIDTDCEFVDHMAIGKATTSVFSTDTDLGDKTSNGNEGPLTPTSTTVGNKGADALLTYTNTFEILLADSPLTIAETGLFDVNNNMFARSPLGPIPVTTGDKITVAWNVIID